MKLRRLSSGIGLATLSLALLAGCNAPGAEGADAAVVTGKTTATAQTLPVVTLYKNPTCQCCAEWAEHMRVNGFRVEVKEAGMDLGRIKAQQGVPPNLASCHTAIVGDYVLEGHVPADLVQQLLTERPRIRGLAVPGMPPGVPGMPEAGPNRDPFQVLAMQPDGSTQLYATR